MLLLPYCLPAADCLQCSLCVSFSPTNSACHASSLLKSSRSSYATFSWRASHSGLSLPLRRRLLQLVSMSELGVSDTQANFSV